MNRWLKAAPYALTILVWCYVPFMVYEENHHLEHDWGWVFYFVYVAVPLIVLLHLWRIFVEKNKLLFIAYLVGNLVVLVIGWLIVFGLSGGVFDL